MIRGETVGEIPVSSLDFAILAESLGVADGGDGLVKSAQQKIEEYVSDPNLATHWLLDQTTYSVSDLMSALCHGSNEGIVLFPIYLSQAFYLAAKQSKKADATIRWYLYNEDFLYSMSQTAEGAKELMGILDLRTIDFFLPEINSDEWSESWNTEGLFKQLSFLTKAAELVGRGDLVKCLYDEIEKKRKAYAQIVNDRRGDDEGFTGLHDSVISNVGFCAGSVFCNKSFFSAFSKFLWQNLNKFKKKLSPRCIGASEWRGYLGVATWNALHLESQKDLVNEFISREATKQGLYSNWIQSITSLLKVVERELNIALLTPLKNHVEESEYQFTTSKRDQFKKRTFDLIVDSHENATALTFGELEFVLKFWDNAHMDECTNLFQITRKRLRECGVPSEALVKSIQASFQEEFFEGDPPWNMVKLRNSCAHPGEESHFENSQIYKNLHEVLGDPPKELLHIIVVKFRM